MASQQRHRLPKLMMPALSEDERQMVDLCDGNPLLIEPVAAILRSGGPVPAPAGSAASPAWVRRLLLSELAGLDELAQRFLRAAGVFLLHSPVPLQPDDLADGGRDLTHPAIDG